MNATNFLESAIGNALFLGQAFQAATEWHLALFTTSPDEAGSGGVEVNLNGTGYARQRLDPGANWAKRPAQDQDGRTVYYNALAVQFPNAVGHWGTVTYLGLFNQNGDLCFIVPLTTPKTIAQNDLGPAILAGELEIAIG